MRIALLSREYPPDTGWGGIATYYYHLAQGLKSIGHDVEVFSLSADDADHFRVEDGLQVYRVAMHDHQHTERLIRECSNTALSDIHKCFPHFRYVVNASLSLWNRFEQVHAEKPFDVLDGPELFSDSLFIATRRNVPHVVRLLTPHAKFIADQLHNIDRSLDHEMVAMLERFAMYSCDVITSPSNDLAQWVANDLNYPVDKIMIVRDPIDCEMFKPEGKCAFEAPDKVKVLFVGRLEERKGVHYLADAIPHVVARYPNVHFYFLGADTKTGPGNSSVLEELKRRLNRSGSLNAVTFLPPVSHFDVPNYVRSADISVVPSLYDNSPFTAIEALAAGKPVIGTSAGGTPEYVIHNQVGLIVPARDSVALAEAIEELVGNKEKRERFGAAARHWAKSQYAPEIIAIEAMEVFRTAQRNFAANGGRSLNMYERTQFVSNVNGLCNSLDLAFHDLRLRWSIRYRISTAIHRAYVDMLEFGKLARSRPKFAAAQFALFVLRPALRFFPQKNMGNTGTNGDASAKRARESVVRK